MQITHFNLSIPVKLKTFGDICLTQSIRREAVLADYIRFWADNDEIHHPEEVTDQDLSIFFTHAVLPYNDTLELEAYLTTSPLTITGDQLEAFKDKLLLDFFKRMARSKGVVEKIKATPAVSPVNAYEKIARRPKTTKDLMRNS